MLKKTDVVVVGAGHNGLACAYFLAQKGLDVVVLEEKPNIGGATKTEYPFKKAPFLGTSSGSYLLGLMPPELGEKLGVRIPIIKRDPHYFLPTPDRRYLLFGSDAEAMRSQFLEFFSESDWRANEKLGEEISALREDWAPAWMADPVSAEETAERYIRPALRRTFLDLVSRPVEEYLDRFGFKSDLLVSMYAVTDAFSGLNATFGTPGAGYNFLVHNMCRLPGSGGAFMIVQGGMGTVARLFAERAVQAGARILTDAPVAKINSMGGKVTGVTLSDGRQIEATAVVCNSDPFRMLDLAPALPEDFRKKIDGMKRDGSTLKINLALSGLPRFSCLKEDRGQYSTTIHLLPDEKTARGKIIDFVKSEYEKSKAGLLPDFPTIEWYIHTIADPTLRDPAGHHNSAFFIQWVPYELKGQRWEDVESQYVQKLLNIADRYAPGTSDLVVDTYTLTPPKIERDFGITRGHIHHIDNTIGFDQRVPYRTPLQGLYSCSAGCHPAGSVIGASGHNSARAILRDMGVGRA